ncbi:MAG: YtxH domain-containing protein [Myxococcota bacterium]
MTITKEDLLSNLPWLANKAAPAPAPVSNDLLPALAIFGAGLIVGAGLGLLLAPKAGSELRNDIADRANDLSQHLPNLRHNDDNSVSTTA